MESLISFVDEEDVNEEDAGREDVEEGVNCDAIGGLVSI